MLIGIDGHRLCLRERQGLGVYSYNLLRSLSKIDKKNQYLILTSRQDELSLTPNFNFVNIPALNEVIWEQVALPLELKKRALDLVHFTVNSAPVFYTGKMVFTIHDLAFSHYQYKVPGLYYQLVRYYRRFLVPRIAKRAQAVITVSNHTKRELIERLGLKEEKVKVIPEAAGNSFHQIKDNEHLDKFRHRYSLPEKYILALGSLEPRKNTKGIIDAYAYLHKTKNLDHALVLVGVGKEARQKIKTYLNSKKIFNRVIMLGYLNSTDLNLLYNGAEVFIFPSFYEGFGLPILEAMACGTPVITSNVSSLPEVAGDAALLTDPNDIEDLAAAITTILSDESLRNKLKACGLKRSLEFSWEETAKKTLEVYEKAVNDI